MLFEIFPKKYHIAVTMPKKNCISIQQCFVTGSQPLALKCFRVLKWNNLPWSISAHRFGIVGRNNLLQSSDRQGLLNNKYTLGQVWRHILKQVMSSVISIFFIFPRKKYWTFCCVCSKSITFLLGNVKYVSCAQVLGDKTYLVSDTLQKALPISKSLSW